jgi:hypothetical protein
MLCRCQTHTYPSQFQFIFQAQEVPGSILGGVLGKFSSDLVLPSAFRSPLGVRSPSNGNDTDHDKIHPFPFGDISLSWLLANLEFSVTG